jgi:hypothetical protein
MLQVAIIQATWQAEIRRIVIQRQPLQTVHETLSQKKTFKKRNGGGFKPQYHKGKKKSKRKIGMRDILSRTVMSTGTCTMNTMERKGPKRTSWLLVWDL